MPTKQRQAALGASRVASHEEDVVSPGSDIEVFGGTKPFVLCAVLACAAAKLLRSRHWRADSTVRSPPR